MRIHQNAFTRTLKEKMISSISAMKKEVETISSMVGYVPYHLQMIERKTILHINVCSPDTSYGISNMCKLFSEPLFIGESLAAHIHHSGLQAAFISCYAPISIQQINSYINLFVYNKNSIQPIPFVDNVLNLSSVIIDKLKYGSFVIGVFNDEDIKTIESFGDDISSRILVVGDGCNLDKVLYNILSDIMVGLDIPDIEFPDSRKPVIESLGSFIDYNINKVKEIDKLVKQVALDKEILSESYTLDYIINFLSIMILSEAYYGFNKDRDIEYDIFKSRYRFKSSVYKSNLGHISKVVEYLMVNKPDVYIDKDGNKYIIVMYSSPIINSYTNIDLTPIIYSLIRIFYGIENVILLETSNLCVVSMTSNISINNELSNRDRVEFGALGFVTDVSATLNKNGIEIYLDSDMHTITFRSIQDITVEYLQVFYSYVNNKRHKKDTYNFYY